MHLNNFLTKILKKKKVLLETKEKTTNKNFELQVGGVGGGGGRTKNEGTHFKKGTPVEPTYLVCARTPPSREYIAQTTH